MREELLHFIWRFRHFNQQQLFTGSGEAVQVLSPGEQHADQGPDFRNATIRIGDRVCRGPVELHVHASDWVRHAHDGDVHYRDTILHVVWINDWPAEQPTPGSVPILELQERVPKLLLGRYDRWMKHPVFVPCERQLPEVGDEVRRRWLGELVLQRLQRRALIVGRELEANRGHWETATWIWMARTMGTPVNTLVFEAIARSLPVTILARHREQPLQLEALLLGQAGLLEAAFSEAYPLTLQREYRFLRHKLGLTPVTTPVSFLRMRPAGFPTIRLVELALLNGGSTGWFARIREARSAQDLLDAMQVEAGEYWNTHYLLDRPAPACPKRLGAAMQTSLLVNAFVPLLFTYGWLRKEPDMQEKALRWLREMPVEKNTVLGRWRQLGVSADNAGDGQALLELKKQYCDARRCLDCAIGNRWLISLVNTG